MDNLWTNLLFTSELKQSLVLVLDTTQVGLSRRSLSKCTLSRPQAGELDGAEQATKTSIDGTSRGRSSKHLHIFCQLCASSLGAKYKYTKKHLFISLGNSGLVKCQL